MTFDAALAFVLAAEGGETNDPADSGGHTRFGIAQASHPTVDVAALTLAQASEIYRADYWNQIHGDDLPPRVAFVLFDTAVNMSATVAVSLLQVALGVQIDGKVGPRTMRAAMTAGEAIIPRLLRLRARRYVDIAEMKPYQQRFLNGWLERCFAVQAAAMGLA